MNITVIDKQGGGVGRAIVEKIRKALPEVNIVALGTNSIATGQMLRAGADEGATGENAIIYNMQHVDIVVGVIGILSANSMMGELSPAMAAAIGGSRAFKVLLPFNRCRIHVVGVPEKPIGHHIDEGIRIIREYIEGDSGRKER